MATRSPTQAHAYWGSFAFYSDLPNVAGSPIQKPTLEAGDQAYIANTTSLYVCVDATQGAAVWTAAAAGSIRSYGVCTLAYVNLAPPVDAVTAEKSITSNGGNIALWSYFDTWYFRCKVRLRFSEIGAAPYLDVTRTFANQTDLLAFVNANRINDQVMVEMEVFDVVDGSLPPPANVYGKNRLFAGLLGEVPGQANRPKYWSRGRPPVGSTYYAGNKIYDTRSNALYALWQACHPTISMPDPTVDNWNDPSPGAGADAFGCFWISTNRIRRYDMPRFDAALSIPGSPVAPSSLRYVRQVDTNTGITTTVPRSAGGSPAIFGTLSGTPAIYYVAIDGGASPTVQGWTARDAFKKNAELIGGNWSVIVGYPMLRETDPGVYEASVLIKPVGVDTFFFDAFDQSRYQLEAVGDYRNDGRLMLQSVPITGVAFDRRSTTPVFVQSLSAVMRPVRRYIQSGRNGYYPGRVRFQYRDLITGMVSPFSPAGIEPVVRKRARPFALMVRNRPES